MRYRVLHGFWMLCSLLLAGCAAIERAPLTPMQLQQDALQSRETYQRTQADLMASLVKRVQLRGDHTLDILLLSGGGQNGAYGIGFLRGWWARQDASMPRFDLVTGISTGALQAPFALLGTEAALDKAGALYRDSADHFLPGFDWLFWLNRTGGILDTENYNRTISDVMNPAMIAALKAEFAQGRGLAIGTTDFDLGIGRIWNMADVLNAEAGSQRARSVLIASSAIPGIFPPVLIDGHVHADGGVVSNVLIEPDRLGYQLLAKGLRAAGIEQPVTVRLWVIMNQWNFPKPASINPASVSEMSRRSSLLLFWAQQPQILQHLQDQARAVNAEFPGLRVEVHATAIPSELASEPGADKLFDKAWMDRMQTLGYSRAQSAAPWDEFAPVYARPAAIQSLTIQDMGLQNTDWKLLSIDGLPARVNDNVREPHLVFHAGGKLTGSDGCNRLMGGYTTHNDQLALTPLATTRMACPDLGGSDAALTRALGSVNRWQIKDTILELFHDQTLRVQFQATALK